MELFLQTIYIKLGKWRERLSSLMVILASVTSYHNEFSILQIKTLERLSSLRERLSSLMVILASVTTTSFQYYKSELYISH